MNKLGLMVLIISFSTHAYNARTPEAYEQVTRIEQSLNLQKKFPMAFECSPSMTEINLEQTTLKNIPHDHQDGLQSCYANVAKNFLIGLTDGQINPSYTDLALHAKARKLGNKMTTLNYANSCDALEAAKEVGACPVEYSPLETGGPLLLGQGFYSKKITNNQNQVEKLTEQNKMLESLKEFLTANLPLMDLRSEMMNEELSRALKRGTVNTGNKDEPKICLPTLAPHERMPYEFRQLSDYLNNTGPAFDFFQNKIRTNAIVDIFQAALAPACADPAKRIPVETNFSCYEVDVPKSYQGLDKFRKAIVTKLLQGMPVGKVSKIIDPVTGQKIEDTNSTHITTIVGLRYNPSSKQCDYLIRDSADATSQWINETQIMKDALTITLVNKLPN